MCLLCVVCALFVLGTRNSSKQHFASKLHSAIQDALKDNTPTFTMLSVTNFTWDALFIFGPYTHVDEIEKALGFSWPPAKKSGIEHNDTFCLLVFVHKGKVVQYCEHSRRDGDFSSLSSANKITPNAAVFSIIRGENDWLVVTMENWKK